MADTPLFLQLLPFQWRSVTFPVTSMSISLSQDLAAHKSWNKDGAEMEPTGRDALVFSASIPFRNGVAPARTERFGTLYPDAFRAFLGAMADKSADVLVHPELGEIRVVPQKADARWDGNKTDGVDVEASWVATTEDTDGLQDALATPSPVTQAQLAATSLDGALRLSADQLPKTREFEPSFADAMRGFQGIGDQIGLFAGGITGQLDALKYRVGEVGNAFARLDDPRNFAAADAVSKLKQAVAALSKSLGSERTVAYYRAPRDITLAGLAAIIPADLNSLRLLNPRLLQSPIVPADTAVRYNPR